MLTFSGLSLKTPGRIYSCYVRSVMLYGSEFWGPTKAVLQRIVRNDRSMIRLICGVKLADRVSSDTLLRRLNIVSIESLIQSNRLRWFGHVQRSEQWINRITNLNINGKRSRGHPKKSWRSAVDEDRRDWKNA